MTFQATLFSERLSGNCSYNGFNEFNESTASGVASIKDYERNGGRFKTKK